MRNQLKNTQKIVIKAGTSVLSTSSGKISQKSLENIGTSIRALIKTKKKQTVLVSSGAIAFGMEAFGFKKRPSRMATLQACAATGQIRLMRAYEKFFNSKKLPTAQLLLTRDGLEMRKRFLNARHTLNELLRLKALPIVNENDTVASEEIAFGDNDVLSVQVAHLMHADLLIVLSDVDGFYLKDGSRVREVSSELDIDKELVKHLRDTQKHRTVGGMRAKLEAARLAMKLGIPLLLVNGHDPKIIEKVFKGEDVGTLFYAKAGATSARKKWIAYSAARKGSITLDAGACQALIKNKRSLLPSGVTKIRGAFGRGDVIELSSKDGGVIGRGVVRYSSRELQKIAGKKTQEITKILGYQHKDEVVHRNDLVVWG